MPMRKYILFFALVLLFFGMLGQNVWNNLSSMSFAPVDLFGSEI